VNGLNFQGKHNVNERHNNAGANDYEIVILDKGFGLPEAAVLGLAQLKDAANRARFDPTRQTGGERYQGELVEIQNVRFADPSLFGSDSDMVLVDETGRTLDAYLGLNPGFDSVSLPEVIGADGYFAIRGILDQKSASNMDGYRLLVMQADDILGGDPALQPGDANEDLQFDQFDLIQVQQAAKYLSGLAATWGEGDWDAAPGGQPGSPPVGDGQFDQQDIIAALSAGLYRTGPYGSMTATSMSETVLVPEPTGVGLAIVACVAILLVGRRGREGSRRAAGHSGRAGDVRPLMNSD
jgi:hypothetical protein